MCICSHVSLLDKMNVHYVKGDEIDVVDLKSFKKMVKSKRFEFCAHFGIYQCENQSLDIWGVSTFYLDHNSLKELNHSIVFLALLINLIEQSNTIHTRKAFAKVIIASDGFVEQAQK